MKYLSLLLFMVATITNFCNQAFSSSCIYCLPFSETDETLDEAAIVSSHLKKNLKHHHSIDQTSNETKEKYWHIKTIDKLLSEKTMTFEEKKEFSRSIQKHFKSCLKRASPQLKGKKLKGQYVLNLDQALQKITCGGFVEASAKIQYYFQDNSMNLGISKPYIDKNTYILGNSEIIGGKAKILNKAIVAENAVIFGNSIVKNYARVFGHAWVEDSIIAGHAKVYGHSWIYSGAGVFGHAKVFEQAHISERSLITENATISGDAWVLGGAHIGGDDSFNLGRIGL